jgi:hypothetical protein
VTDAGFQPVGGNESKQAGHAAMRVAAGQFLTGFSVLLGPALAVELDHIQGPQVERQAVTGQQAGQRRARCY